MVREKMQLELILTRNLFATDAAQIIMLKAGILYSLSHNNE